MHDPANFKPNKVESLVYVPGGIDLTILSFLLRNRMNAEYSLYSIEEIGLRQFLVSISNVTEGGEMGLNTVLQLSSRPLHC